MKILTAIILLLLVAAVKAVDPGDPRVSSYPDTCNYTYTRVSFRCGDLCTLIGWCHCGSETVKKIYNDTESYCCGESCTLDPYGRGNCSQGRKLSKSSPFPCNTTMHRWPLAFLLL